MTILLGRRGFRVSAFPCSSRLRCTFPASQHFLLRCLCSESPPPASTSLNLRKFLRGLYLKVHPDLLAGESADAVTINEKSIQTLNSFLDILHDRISTHTANNSSAVTNEHPSTFRMKFYFAETSVLIERDCRIVIPPRLRTKDDRRGDWSKFALKAIREVLEKFDVPVPESIKVAETRLHSSQAPPKEAPFENFLIDVLNNLPDNDALTDSTTLTARDTAVALNAAQQEKIAFVRWLFKGGIVTVSSRLSKEERRRVRREAKTHLLLGIEVWLVVIPHHVAALFFTLLFILFFVYSRSVLGSVGGCSVRPHTLL